MGRVRVGVPGLRLVVRMAALMGVIVTIASAAQEQIEPVDPSDPVAEVVVDRLTEPPIGADTEQADAAEPQTAPVGTSSVLALLRTVNPMLIPLVLCSIATLGYTLERVVALRRARVIPKDFVERFLDRLSSGKLDRDRAAELCRAHESPVARIFGHAIRYWGQPATAIRQAVEADAASEIADMKRNVRVLNGTATLAPLLGLLGTVVGLIEAFDALGGPAVQDASRGQALANGISLALVATAFGLAIAIVSVIAYYALLNRIDRLVRELDEQVRRVIELVSAETWVGTDRRSMPGMTAAERGRPESRLS
ncbi:MotA/TolQ/ExbB proton channel family protein [Tautonia rosea]|uniref:MotA/TolQ/ExbB proton channel family protein n=1 Tax=Tautonia rosea TaxID=2728037 RepID=UPI001474866D|nr:MotA/TolQ/ExbB proton channel family protein [Tautonia rosea]